MLLSFGYRSIMRVAQFVEIEGLLRMRLFGEIGKRGGIILCDQFGTANV